MKRSVLMVVIAAVVVALPVAAQDFSSPKAQFISFSVGVPVGYDLKAEDITGGYNLGVSFAIIDNFQVGYDYVNLTGSSYNLIRFAYSFTSAIGAAVSFGANTPSSGATTDPAVGIGIYADILQKRAAIGFAHGFRLRVDYLTKTSDFGKGALTFGLGVNFGL